MAATLTMAESNGAGETITDNPANTNMGDTDAAALDPLAYPITPGNNTYEKYQRIKVSNMGGSSQIKNLKIWRTGALGGSAVHVTNARTSSYAQKTYATPVKTDSTQATQAMPTDVPASANLGIGGALNGIITTATSYSDYLVHQIQTDVADVAGSTSTMNYGYDEVA